MAEPKSIDQEIEAIRAVVAALEPLDGASRGRVIRYLQDRLNLSGDSLRSNIAKPSVDETPTDDDGLGEPAQVQESEAGATKVADLKDIRSLVAEKRPKSAIEMATLVAYYLSELAPVRKHTINVRDLQRYFKQGAYPLPKIARFTLTNAKDQGLLEVTARGEYRLTPVGHNLVAHRMPTKVATSSVITAARNRRSGKRKKRA